MKGCPFSRTRSPPSAGEDAGGSGQPPGHGGRTPAVLAGPARRATGPGTVAGESAGDLLIGGGLACGPARELFPKTRRVLRGRNGSAGWLDGRRNLGCENLDASAGPARHRLRLRTGFVGSACGQAGRGHGPAGWPGLPRRRAEGSQRRLDRDAAAASDPDLLHRLPPQASLPGFCSWANGAPTLFTLRDDPTAGREADRILWGGYYAIYHRPRHSRCLRSAARHVRDPRGALFATFPQLEGIG